MATEYSRIKLRDKTSDPCSVSQTNGKSVQFTSHEPVSTGGGKLVQKRSIVRDGQVVTITCLTSGRTREIPWTGVVEGEPVKTEPAQTAKKS